MISNAAEALESVSFATKVVSRLPGMARSVGVCGYPTFLRQDALAGLLAQRQKVQLTGRVSLVMPSPAAFPYVVFGRSTHAEFTDAALALGHGRRLRKSFRNKQLSC